MTPDQPALEDVVVLNLAATPGFDGHWARVLNRPV